MKEFLKKIPFGTIVYFLLAVFAAAGTVGALLHGYTTPSAQYLFCISTAAAAVFAAIAFLPQKGRKWVWFALFALWLLLGWHHREALAEGLYNCWGELSRILVKYLPVYVPAQYRLREQEMYAFFYVLVPYLALLTCAVSRLRSFLLTLLLTAPLLLFSWLELSTLSAAPPHVLILVWIAMALQAGIPRTHRPVAKIPMLCIFLASAAASALICSVTPENYRPWEGAPAARARLNEVGYAIGNAVNDMILSVQQPAFLPGGGSLDSSKGEVDLEKAWSGSGFDRDVLRVHSTDPGALYLRAYSASVYHGNSWLQTDGEGYPAELSFEPLAYSAKDSAPQSERSEITVETLVPNSRYLLTPYLLTEVGADPAPEWERDVRLIGAGQKEYTFRVLSADASEYLITGSNLWLLHLDYDAWYNPQYQYFTTADFPYADIFSSFYPPDETAYMNYAIDEYTQLPDETREFLLDWWAKAYPEETQSMGDERVFPFWLWENAAVYAARAVQNAAAYTTALAPHPEGEDFIEYFLTESKKGDCVYFATATTALLRALGLPARYAEGYVLEESDFDADGWATATSDDAHAWAEVLLPGAGWIPVESTPGGAAPGVIGTGQTGEGTTPEEPEETPEVSAEPTPEPEPSESAEPTPPPETEAPEASKETAAGWMDAVLWGIWIGAPVILAASPFFYRQFAIGRRKKRFHQPNANRAALEIYHAIVRLADYGGTPPSKQAEEIAHKARFSQHTISAGELELLQEEYRLDRSDTRSCLPKRRRPAFWLEGF